MPALAEAAKLGAKAQKSGFDWPSWRDLLPKLEEETRELEAEAASNDPARKPAVEAELGDLLFTVVNLGRHLGVDAEMALRGCNLRFRERFREMERAASRPLEELSPDELEALWTQAKQKLGARHHVDGADRKVEKIARSRDMIEIRPCQGFDELEACVQLQIETWGYDDSDVIPRKTFLVAQSIGGQVIGAFDSGNCRRRRKIAGWFCLFFARHKSRTRHAPRLSALAHAGRKDSLSESRAWQGTQAGATT